MYIGISESIVAGRRILGLSVLQPGRGVFHRSAPTAAVRPPPTTRPMSLTAPFPHGRLGGGRMDGCSAPPPCRYWPKKQKSRPPQHTHVFVHPPPCAFAVAQVRYRGTACDTALPPREVLLDASSGSGAPVRGGHALEGCLPIRPAAVGGGTHSDMRTIQASGLTLIRSQE